MGSLARALLAALAGLAHAASMGSPWDGQPVWWLQWMAIGLLVGLLDRCNFAQSAAWLGWMFTTAWLCGTFWWLYVSMHTYGGLHPALTVLAIVALAGVLALYYAAACALYVRLAPASPAGAALLFSALWTMAEMCRGTWFTGFGWGAAAYAHLDGLAVLAPFIGAYGVGAVAVFVACFVALNLSHWLRAKADLDRQTAWVAPGLAVLTVALLAHDGLRNWLRPTFSQAGKTLSVTLLQGNIKQNEKFEQSTGVADALTWYGAQISSAQSALVVAPETALPLLPQQLPDGYWQALLAQFGGAERALLVGIPLGSYRDGYTNSVVGLHAGKSYQYDKHHLVPFGEFIPPMFKWFTNLMNIPLGDFNRGAVGQPSFELQGQRLAPNICYEDLFGEELGARFANPLLAPTIFVNVSNIGWFGNTVAIDQHLSISRLRAMEFERPFIRATNTGATVVIDHTGRVTHELPRHTRGVLLADVQGRTGSADTGFGLTPFARWVSRFGLWPYWLLALGVAVVALVFKRRSNRL